MIILILIPTRDVPERFSPRNLSNKTPSCELMLEMFVDLNCSFLFDCPHNTAELCKVINFMFSQEDKDIENAIEERYNEETTAKKTFRLKRSTSEVSISVRIRETGLDTRWRSQPLVNKPEEDTVNADREALRNILEKEIPKTHRPGKVLATSEKATKTLSFQVSTKV